jgi:hypothetical protein
VLDADRAGIGLAETGAGPAEVDAMHAAWTKAVLLQAILWARPYVAAGDF